MASAINSLPVPVSPLINTVASVGATIRTMPSTCRRAKLLPTMRGSFLPLSPKLSNDALLLHAGASNPQIDDAAMLHLTDLSIPSLKELISVSLPRDPLADVYWA